VVLRVLLRQVGIVLGIVLGIVVAIPVAIVIATGGSSNKGTLKPNSAARLKSTPPKAARAELPSPLAGIPQRGSTLGDPNAPVTLQYFGDLQCPFCKQFTFGALPSLIQRYVRGGMLKIEYHSLKTATRDAETFKTQQVAALAAGKQNHMWQYIELFYREEGRENSGYVTERYLDELAQQLSGLNLIAWTSARNDAALARAITSDAREASSAGLTSTPTFRLWRSQPTPYASTIERLLSGVGSSGTTPSARQSAPA
jgi:Thioredoxin